MNSAIEKSLRLFCIRDGATEWSLSGQSTGRTDIPVTRLAEDKARELGQWLRTILFAHAPTSPLQCAQRTCDSGSDERVNNDAVIKQRATERWEYEGGKILARSPISQERP